MTLEQVYAAIGGDYKGVMERLPSADFVRRFALKFLQDDSFPNLKKALEEKDAPTAFRAAHTLKGVCQNLGFDALYVPSSALSVRSEMPYSLDAPLKLRFSLWIRLMISTFCVPLYFRCPFGIQKHPIS